MDYQCQLCDNYKKKNNCSHIINNDNVELCVTYINIEKSSKGRLIVNNLNCSCLKEIFYINKYQVCNYCLKASIDYICLECDERYCYECTEQNLVSNHKRYDSIWQEMKFLQPPDSKSNEENHRLIHFKFSSLYNHFYLLFKDSICLVNKIHFLSLLKVTGINEFLKYKNILEKSSASTYEEILKHKRLVNASKIGTINCMRGNIEKNTNNLPFLEADIGHISIKEVIDEEGMLTYKSEYEHKLIQMAVLSGNSLNIALTNRKSVACVDYEESLSPQVSDYSKEFNKIIGMFSKANEQLSFLVQSQGNHHYSNNNNHNNPSYNVDLVEYSLKNRKLSKTALFHLNYNNSLLLNQQLNESEKPKSSSSKVKSYLDFSNSFFAGMYSNIPYNINPQAQFYNFKNQLNKNYPTFDSGTKPQSNSQTTSSGPHNISHVIQSMEKTAQNMNYVGNYLICCFDYPYFTSLEVFTLNSADNKYNITRMICSNERFYLLNSLMKGNEVVKQTYYSVLSFIGKIQIVMIPTLEVVYVIDTLDQAFRIFKVNHDLFFCDKFQLYKAKEDSGKCLTLNQTEFVQEEICDMCSYKDYLIVLTRQNSLKFYYRRDLLYIQTVKMKVNVKLIKSISFKENDYVVALTCDMRVSLLSFKGLKDLSNNIIDTKLQYNV